MIKTVHKKGDKKMENTLNVCNHTFIVHKVNLDGSLSHKEYLNHLDELHTWLSEKYGKFATVKITSELSGKSAIYTDNGNDFEKIKGE